MNWYQTSSELEKFSFRNPLDILTNELAKQISTKIRNGLSSDFWVINNSEFPLLKDIEIQNVEINFVSDPSLENPFDIKSSSEKPTDPRNKYGKIKIYFVFNPQKFNKKFWNKTYQSLIYNIRHELEHFFSVIKYYNMEGPGEYENNNDIYEFIFSNYKYLIDLSERESFVRGFLLQAKKRNIPAEILFKRYMLEIIFDKDFYNSNVMKKAMSDPTILKNGLTILETCRKIMNFFSIRLDQVRKGLPSLDLKEKNKKIGKIIEQTCIKSPPTYSKCYDNIDEEKDLNPFLKDLRYISKSSIFSHSWINLKGERPKEYLVINPDDVVININDAIDKKWVFSNERLRKMAKDYMVSNSGSRTTIIFFDEKFEDYEQKMKNEKL